MVRQKRVGDDPSGKTHREEVGSSPGQEDLGSADLQRRAQNLRSSQSSESAALKMSREASELETQPERRKMMKNNIRSDASVNFLFCFELLQSSTKTSSLSLYQMSRSNYA